MSQLNIHMTPKFERNLQQFMESRHIKTKSEALRTALDEILDPSSHQAKSVDYKKWLGLANYPKAPKKRKITDDDIWESGWL